MYRAVLDTCALVPGRQRDFMRRLAAANAIVTDDSRAGFTTSAILKEAGIDIVYPHEFAANAAAAHPEAGLRALVAMSRRMTTPSRTPHEISNELGRYGMDGVAGILSPRPGEAEWPGSPTLSSR